MGFKSKHLSRLEKKEVKAIASSVIVQKAERKIYNPAAADLNLQRTVASAVIIPGGLSAGTSDSGRIGNKIQVQSINIKGTLQPGSDTDAVFRIMLVQWEGESYASTGLSSPPLDDFVTPLGTIDNMNLWYLRRRDSDAANTRKYKVLYDQTWYFDNHTSGAQRPFELTLPGSKLANKGVVSFSTETTTNYDNPIYMYGFGTDDVAKLRFRYRSLYTDV